MMRKHQTEKDILNEHGEGSTTNGPSEEIKMLGQFEEMVKCEFRKMRELLN